MDLVGGAYYSRSPIANAQRCVNLYPESGRKDAVSPWTHYQRPGLRLLSSPTVSAPGRGLYRASNGNSYYVSGQAIYSVANNFALTQIGQLITPRLNPVAFIDNGVNILLVDGSLFGYQINLGDNVVTQVIDPSGAFLGATSLGILDGFILGNIPNSPSFFSTLDNVISFDPLYTAAKNGYPDLLQAIVVNYRELLLLGTLKSEIWYDAGNPNFPFAELPGIYIEHGCVAPYSAVGYDNSVFWLGQDLSGVGFVYRQRGYKTTVISNYAISAAIKSMRKAGANISDAIAYVYVDGGHVFYVITFVSGDQTWVFDDSVGEPDLAWHQRGWSDPNGILHRERANCHALVGATGSTTNVVADWQTGDLYALDDDYCFDYVAGVAGPISFIRTFPQIMIGMGSQGPQLADGKSLTLTSFVADFDCGNGPIQTDGNNAILTLSISHDRGRTFDQFLLDSTGAPGEFSTSPNFQPIGVGRYPVLQLNWSFPGALNGGWINARVNNS